MKSDAIFPQDNWQDDGSFVQFHFLSVTLLLLLRVTDPYCPDGRFRRFNMTEHLQKTLQHNSLMSLYFHGH